MHSPDLATGGVKRGNPAFSDPETHPGKATQWKPGNTGKPKGAAPIGKRRARVLAKERIVAEAAGRKAPDFRGDALAYMQAVYSGQIVGDPLRMSAAAQALKFERPALAATLLANVSAGDSAMAEQEMLARLAGLDEEALEALEAAAGQLGLLEPAEPDLKLIEVEAEETADPEVVADHPELAWKAAGQPAGDRAAHRRHDDGDRPPSLLRD